MTTEEKAKAYDKISKEVKEFFEGKQKMYSDVNQTLEYLFPELKESEDERIKNRLIKLIKMSSEVGGFALHKWEADEMLTWLEKQAPKPKWSEKDERILYAIIADFKAFKYSITSTLESHFDECLDWLKSIKKRIGES